MNDQYQYEIDKLKNKISSLELRLKEAEYLLGEMGAQALSNCDIDSARYVMAYGGIAKELCCYLGDLADYPSSLSKKDIEEEYLVIYQNLDHFDDVE